VVAAAPYLPFLVFPVAIGGGLLLDRVAVPRCHRAIEGWAAVSGFKVRSVKRLWISGGTWGLTYQYFQAFHSRRHRGRFFDLSLSDSQGVVRHATAIVGGGFGGIAADSIEVRIA